MLLFQRSVYHEEACISESSSIRPLGCVRSDGSLWYGGGSLYAGDAAAGSDGLCVDDEDIEFHEGYRRLAVFRQLQLQRKGSPCGV